MPSNFVLPGNLQPAKSKTTLAPIGEVTDQSVVRTSAGNALELELLASLEGMLCLHEVMHARAPFKDSRAQVALAAVAKAKRRSEQSVRLDVPGMLSALKGMVRLYEEMHARSPYVDSRPLEALVVILKAEGVPVAKKTATKSTSDVALRHAVLRDALGSLLAWADLLGGWDAPCWDQARKALFREQAIERPRMVSVARLNSVVSDLLAWSERMGGWDDPCWAKAREAVAIPPAAK